jgi:glycosyltransferase involved in cell wall biosynthesis
MRWHIITCEYPPQLGGVSDYTFLVARALAARGEQVQVWCPAAHGETPQLTGVSVSRAMGAMTPADLRRVGQLLDRFPAPRRLFVQWVPHGYGYRAMNLPFCLWLWHRAARRGDQVELMVHEPYLTFSRNAWRANFVAAVHRLMTVVLLRSARRAWISIPAWAERLRPYAIGRRVPFQWLPVPSSLPEECEALDVAAVRARYAQPGQMLIGHFGTYGRPIVELLRPSLSALLDRHSKASVLLIGQNSERFRDDLVGTEMRLADRVHAAGTLTAEGCAAHLKACDLLLQPYPDGVSSRRTTVMAGLALGLPVATTKGELSEAVWAASRAVSLTAANDIKAMTIEVERLLNNADERRQMGSAGLALYRERFRLEHTIAALRNEQPKPCESQL